MIRRLIPSDIPAVLELWLRSTKQAHPFIAPGYWDENTGLVKDMLTRQAETYVFADKHRIKGFVSLLPENFIGALFVDEKFRSRRIGTKLLNYILRRRSAAYCMFMPPIGRPLIFTAETVLKSLWNKPIFPPVSRNC